MPLSIKAKQVASVTSLVGLAVILVSAWDLASLARVELSESQARAELIAQAIFQRTREVVGSADSQSDPYAGLRSDAGLQSILESSQAFPKNVVYAAVVDVKGVVLAHSDPAAINQTLPAVGDLSALLAQGPISQMRAIFAEDGQTLEVREPLFRGTTEFGSIRVGISTLLVREDFERMLRAPLLTALAALVGATALAMILAQVVLRPIHVIRSGLARLGRGEIDVSVELPKDAELADLSTSFQAVSARLAADRSELAGQRATLESVVEHLEDAVALFAPDGTLLFANPAMRAALGGGRDGNEPVPADHPYRDLIGETLKAHASVGPRTVKTAEAGERLVLTHLIDDADHRPLGVMLVARNLAAFSQVESTLSYSRKLAALGRLSAGIAHEVKNPLNATMIHLELLKMKLADSPAAMEHVSTIAAQMRRLDEVVQGFLKFTRPEDLTLQPVAVAPTIEALLPIICAEADAVGIEVRVECPGDLPEVSADRTLLQQAFLNLALNACQAMPTGGRLRISASARPNRRVEVAFEDTGIGIPPEHLQRIFDLYFTTKDHGSGIGLSMVYRTIQLHDGEIEVESSPGRGTTFRVLLRQA